MVLAHLQPSVGKSVEQTFFTVYNDATDFKSALFDAVQRLQIVVNGLVIDEFEVKRFACGIVQGEQDAPIMPPNKWCPNGRSRRPKSAAETTVFLCC